MAEGRDKLALLRLSSELRLELQSLEAVVADLDGFQTKYPHIDEFLVRALGSIMADFYNCVERSLRIIRAGTAART